MIQRPHGYSGMDGAHSSSLSTVTNVTRTVFYAWQSDCPSGTNRGFIRKALNRAVNRLNADGYEIVVDEGTAGVAGMPDITNEILKKIDQCAVFVADVTLVGTVDEDGSTKRLSNPSVMYELGYARNALAENRLVALVNTAFGRVEDLPFDIKRARVSPYTRHKPKAADDTEPKQLADLLCESLKAVLDEPISEIESSEANPVDALKRLLPKPDGDIEVEDLISKHTESLATQMGDEERFSVANSMVSRDAAGYRYLADQANLYIDACLPLCELLATGVAFGDSRHDHLWQRTVERIANVASQSRVGVDMSLLDLRYIPTSMLAYSALIAGVDRKNYAAIRAALIDARTRNEENQKVPVISCGDPWSPFRRAVLVANVALIDAESSELCDLDRIGRLLNRTEGRRLRPGSLLLELILRKPLSPIIPDDENYTETFAKAEVFLALMTADAEANADEYIPSPYYGAFTLRNRRTQQARFEQTFIDDALSSGSAWPPLSAGLFGGDVARFRSAAKTVLSGAEEARAQRY